MSDWGKNAQIAIAMLIGAVGTVATIVILVKGPNPEVVALQVKTEERKIQEEKTKQFALQNPGSSVSLLGAKGAPLNGQQAQTMSSYQPAAPVNGPAVVETIPQASCDDPSAVPVLDLGPGRYADYDTPGCKSFRLNSSMGTFFGKNYKIFLRDNPENSCGDMGPTPDSLQACGDWVAANIWKTIDARLGVNGRIYVTTKGVEK